MTVTEKDRKRRALRYLREIRADEAAMLRRMEGIKLTEVIIARNKITMTLAEIDQMIRNTESYLEQEESA